MDVGASVRCMFESGRLILPLDHAVMDWEKQAVFSRASPESHLELHNVV